MQDLKKNYFQESLPLKTYNNSSYKKASFARILIEDGLDNAGDAFAIEIIRALQAWHTQLKIVMQLCTGESPFAGYRKMAGDKVLNYRGLYDQHDFYKIIRKYKKTGSILDSWEEPSTKSFLEKNGIDTRIKPDMSRVVVFALDAIFPQKRTDYFAFANLLNIVCDLWNIPDNNRNFFYGDMYFDKRGAVLKKTIIPDKDYTKIIYSINTEGLKLLEFQAACLLRKDKTGFALNSDLVLDSSRVIGKRLCKDSKGDFRIQRTEVVPLKNSHVQHRFLESMRNQAQYMSERIIKLGGPHITLLGVGPSHEGEGHIGFCEAQTSVEQTCFIGAILDYDRTFHIAGSHAKEFYGFKNMFVTVGPSRMPKLGFITYGPFEMMYRRSSFKDLRKRDLSKEVIVIVIATGNLKSSSVKKAIEEDLNLRYPLSLTQTCRAVFVLDKTAGSMLRILKNPWEFQVLPSDCWSQENIKNLIFGLAESKGRKISSVEESLLCDDTHENQNSRNKAGVGINKYYRMNLSLLSALLKDRGDSLSSMREKIVRQFFSSLIRPGQIVDKLKALGLKTQDTVILINPHMDDAFLSMSHILKEMASYYEIKAYYTSLGYSAVYNDYILGLLKHALSLPHSHIEKLNPRQKKSILRQIIQEKENAKLIPSLDYQVLPYMSRKEKTLRARLLLIDLNERPDLEPARRASFKYKFRNKQDVAFLVDFLSKVLKRMPDSGGQDIDIMRLLKTSARFMESQSALMSLGITYENIYWPLDMSFYGIPGRPLVLNEQDVNKIKDIILKNSPSMIMFNGEGFPDYSGHSNTEIGTLVSLFKLLKESRLCKNLILFQWAGVWDRIRLADSAISLILTRGQLHGFYRAFNYFFPTQAPYAPVLNASSAKPQSFAQDVINNARESANEIVSLINIPQDSQDIIKEGGGVLNYKVNKLKDKAVKRKFSMKKEELERSRFSINLSSNVSICGQASYPRDLTRLSASIIKKAKRNGLISEREDKLFGYSGLFDLSIEGMVRIVRDFHEDMERGLLGKSSSLSMLPTFARMPEGKEKGAFLAIDLGGTTFRILFVSLGGAGKRPRVTIEKFPLKKVLSGGKLKFDYTKGTARKLFSVMTGYIKTFLNKHTKLIKKYTETGCPIPAGFTFSFPVTQTAINKAKLNKWGKQFHIPDLINKDVIKHLSKAIAAGGLKKTINVLSLNNDTVSTLVSGAYLNPICDVGGIVGTGTNFAYFEAVKNIKKLSPSYISGDRNQKMAINIESGYFDKVEQNIYDRLVDKATLNKGEQIAEKMISGLHIGELVRRVLVEAADKGILFNGLSLKELSLISKKDSFPAPYLSVILSDSTSSLSKVKAKLNQWGIKGRHVSLKDLEFVKDLCRVVIKRAARITASIMFAIVTHIDKDLSRKHSICMDGTLFHKCPCFSNDINNAFLEISSKIFQDDRGMRINLFSFPDSSGVGAAIVAATSVLHAKSK